MEFHQVAGHIGTIVPFEDANGSFVVKMSSDLEKLFYETLQGTMMMKIVPKYYGSAIADFPKAGEQVGIKLENLTASMKKPCIMDVKLGRIKGLYGSDADEKKRMRMEQQSLETTSGETGLRICGMKLWDAKSNDFSDYDKKFGRSLNPSIMHTGFQTYFEPDPSMAIPMLSQLLELREIYSQLNVRCYSASALLIYDIDSKQSVVKLLDFAHSEFVSPELGADENCLFALDSLMSYIKSFIDSQSY